MKLLNLHEYNMAVTAVKILYLLYFYGLYYASSLRPFYSLARNYL